MQPIWLIDADSSSAPSEHLQKEIRRQGMDVRAVKFFPDNKMPHDIAGAESIGRDAHVIFTGGPALMRHIQATRRWRPGGWCTFSNFSCDTYYTYFGRYLLNESYTLLPAAEALRRSHSLFDAYACDGRLFIRPSRAKKVFCGTIADEDKYRHLLTADDLDPRTLVVIARPRVISREWRLFVANDEIVTSSQYAVGGRLNTSAGCPREILAFGYELLRHVAWHPDPLFTVDVCESSDKPYLLELNGFSCSSLYQADLEAVVRSARLAAQFT